MKRFLTRSAVLAGVSALALSAQGLAFASVAPTPDDTAAVSGGGVYALAHADGLTYVGGTFTKMGGKPRARVAAVRADGTVDPSFLPSTDGKVDALAVSSDGTTVFLGGTFTTVDGVPRANLAAVDAVTGQLLPDWSADTTGTSPDVKALTVVGDRLYVGGRFSGIDGTGRRKLVALDAATGDLVSAFRPQPNGTINEVKVSPDGSIVYAGGGFSTIGGQSRFTAGAVYADTGLATPFAPAVDGGNVVTAGLTPDGSTFFASTDNNTVFGFDTRLATAPPKWSTKMSGNTQAMACSDTELYIGGHFASNITQKLKRNFFASLNPATGLVTSWDPQATGGKMGVWALLIEGDHLHAGGVFSYFGTDPQRGYARFTGTP